VIASAQVGMDSKPQQQKHREREDKKMFYAGWMENSGYSTRCSPLAVDEG